MSVQKNSIVFLLSGMMLGVPIAQQSIAIAQTTPTQQSSAEQLNSEGLKLFKQGQYQAALEKLQQVLKQVSGGRDRRLEARTLNNIGSVNERLGNYEKALNAHSQALDIYRELKDRSGEGLAINNIGLVFKAIGEYSKALSLYEKAFSIAKEIKDVRLQATTLNNLASLYRGVGEYRKAIDSYQQALVIFRDQLRDRFSEGTIVNNIGRAYDALGQYDKALEFFQQALTLRKEIGDHAGISGTLNNIGAVYAALGKPAKALEYYEQALPIAKETGDRDGESTILNNMGEVYNSVGDYLKAVNSYQQALLIAQKLYDRVGVATALNNMGASLVLGGAYTAAVEPLVYSMQFFEQLRPGLSDRHKITLSDSNRNPYDWLQIALVALNKTNAALEISERSRARAIVELLASRSTKSSAASQQMSQPLDLVQIKQVAKQQNATIVQYSTQYSRKGQDLYIWVIRPDGTVEFRKTPVDPDGKLTGPSELRSATIAQLSESTRGAVGIANRGEAFISVTQGSGEVTKKTDNALRQLHQRLIEPIADLLPKKEIDRVIFIPQGQLFFVPFAALMDVNGKYLIEKHTISTASSIATLKLTAEKRNTKSNRNNNTLVIGNPIMPTLPSGILKPLPGAEAEAKEIALLLNTKPLIGQAAKKSEVVKQMQNASIIHLATHGLLDSAKNDVPGSIALTPDNPNEVGNGLLTANELFDLKLNANLVVLSACDTAKGDITGDGVVGLSRSLIAAGVPSIIVSLWSVNDNSTAFLMKDFYRNLQTMDKAQALRQAMLKTMRQPQYEKPYFWSAFTLIGEAE